MNYKAALRVIDKYLITKFQYHSTIFSDDDFDEIGQSGNGLFLKLSLPNLSVTIEISSGIKRGHGLGIGPSHTASVSIETFEDKYQEVINVDYYKRKNVFGFLDMGTYMCRSVEDWRLADARFSDKYEFEEIAIPFIQDHVNQLELEFPKYNTPEALYEKVESFADYSELDAFVVGFTPVKRMLLKAWVKDPDLDGYYKRITAIYEQLIERSGGDPRGILMLQAIKEAYSGCRKLFDDPTHKPGKVTYAKGPDYRTTK